jgi:succinyl-diaminopimelate desuccinylase
MFFTQPGHFSEIIRSSIKKVTGRDASYGTTGATSDGRFIKDYAPVFEFGLLYKTAHKVDEYASLTDIQQLSNIYFNLLNEYFKI